MLDKLTDNVKFFIMLAVYIVYLTWWAATLSSNVEIQTQISEKTVLLLDKHIEDCNKRRLKAAETAEKIKHLETIYELREGFFNYGTKAGRN